MSDHIHGNHDACDPRYCSDVEIAAQRAEIKRMCEERDSAQRCIEKLTAEIAALRAEVSNLKAQQSAAVCAWEEYSRWPDLPSPVVGRVRFPDGHEEDLALRPEQITGILSGIEKHVRECLPFGVAAVRSHQDIDGLRHKLAALRARVAALEAVERAARSEIAYMDETKAAHPDAVVEPTLNELRAALAAVEVPRG